MTAAPSLPLLAQALARINDVVLITEAEPVERPGPRIVFVNAAFERMTGYRTDEVLGKTPRLLQGPRTDPQVLGTLRDALTRWDAVRVQLTNYRKNGIPFDVEFDVTPVPDETGWYTHWVSIQRDITESTVAERVIAEATTLEELASGVCRELLDYAGATSVSWWMRSAGAPWHVVERGAERQVTPDVPPASPECLVERLHTTGGLEVHLVAERPGEPFGETEPRLVRAVAARSASAADRLFALMQRERMEAALRHAEKLEAIGRLAGGVAHDFNNLLTIVMGNVEYLRSIGPDASEAAAVFDEIERASRRARDLVQHLLAFGRKRRLNHEAFGVNTVVEAAVALLERSTASVLSITTAVEAPAPLALGDPAMLEQVIVNLVMNARDAIAASGRPVAGEVRIIAARAHLTQGLADPAGITLPAGRYVTIDVIDDGPGMPEEVRHRAFDPFFTTRPAGTASGLGLSSAYGAVVAMGGTLELTAMVPHGTRARILLPMA